MSFKHAGNLDAIIDDVIENEIAKYLFQSRSNTPLAIDHRGYAPF